MLKALGKSIMRPDKFPDLDAEKGKVPVSVLMNEKRQKILQFIFKYPCTHLHGIARNFEYSINATRWHLRKLMDTGYIDEFQLGNRKVYFPNKSLQETDIKILAMLNDERFEKLINDIIRTPGITQKEICKRLSKKQSTLFDQIAFLEKQDLIYSQKDGLYTRYYPTTILNTREKVNRKFLKDYRKFIIEILKRDGVEPQILRSTDKKFHIRIKSGKGSSDLVFYFNPYERFVK
jgi:predicted transcriptional regulator